MGHVTLKPPEPYIECLHVGVELGLPVPGQVGEDGVVGDGVPQPAVQPLRQRVTRFRQQQLKQNTAAETGETSWW